MVLRVAVRFALLVAAVASAGAPARAADPQFPLGSRMGFVPPPGFVVSKRFPGFENAEVRSSIVVVTLPPQAYSEIEASMTPANVKQQGVTEEKRETLTLANGKALLVIGTEQDGAEKFRKWMFLGQVPEGAALAAVRVPESAVKTYPDDVIRASLVTLAIRPTVPLDEQLSLVPFKFNELSGLRPVRVIGPTGVVLTDGPKDVPAPSDQPVFIVVVGQGGPEQTVDRANFARNLFTGLSEFKDIRIVSGDMLRLGGGSLPTHELQAEAKDTWTDTPMKLVQWVRFGPGVFIRMVGAVRADQWSAAFPRFRAVRDGVVPREQ
jgi:hypothetical protein